MASLLGKLGVHLARCQLTIKFRLQAAHSNHSFSCLRVGLSCQRPQESLWNQPPGQMSYHSKDLFGYSKHCPTLDHSPAFLTCSVAAVDSLVFCSWRTGWIQQLSPDTPQEYDPAKLFQLSNPQSVNRNHMPFSQGFCHSQRRWDIILSQCLS